MISNAFKEQLIINVYNTQLLLLSNTVGKSNFEAIKHIKNFLLFRKDDGRLVKYKYKDNNINYNICRLLSNLTDPIYSIYQYSEDKEYDIQDNILNDINNILYKKHYIDKSPDYAKYLEDIYD